MHKEECVNISVWKDEAGRLFGVCPKCSNWTPISEGDIKGNEFTFICLASSCDYYTSRAVAVRPQHVCRYEGEIPF